MHNGTILLNHPLVGAAALGIDSAHFGLAFLPAAAFTTIIILAILWTLVWKGIALWSAARNHQTWWFVALLILNTLGILEIVYLLFFRKDNNAAAVTTTVTTEPTPTS